MNYLFKIVFSLIFLLSVGYASGQEIKAGSWGGKVRAGPGMQFQQIASLRNGDPVRLLENTRVMMNGYPWYRISYRGGKTGYQWGGILCSYDNPIGGLYKICEVDNRRQTSAQSQGLQELPCSAESQTRSISGTIPTEIRFQVIGENDETQFKIYWLDYQGRRKFYKHIFAGDTYQLSTSMTHPWLVTAPIPGGGEDCIAIYLPQRNGRTIILR